MNAAEVRTLTPEDFAGMLGEPVSSLSEISQRLIAESAFRYETFSGEERDRVILDILKRIDSAPLKVSGSHRKEDWEAGWSENLKGFAAKGDVSELVPKYFKPAEVLRVLGDYVRPLVPDFLPRFHALYCRMIFEQYLGGAGAIWEFGCGPGHNLVALSELYPDKEICGLDWAGSAVQLINKLGKKYPNIKGSVFDMFHPDAALDLPPDCAVVTIHALEQTGTGHRPFLEYILSKSPALCLHIEPVAELYDNNTLFDYLAVKYHRKRGYLENYLDALYGLEKEKRIEIMKVRRAFMGSMYDEGYSLIIWRPR